MCYLLAAREYLKIYRGLGFLANVWPGSSPSPSPPLPPTSCLSFSVFLLVTDSPVELTDGRGCRGRGISYDGENAWSSCNHSILSSCSCVVRKKLEKNLQPKAWAQLYSSRTFFCIQSFTSTYSYWASLMEYPRPQWALLCYTAWQKLLQNRPILFRVSLEVPKMDRVKIPAQIRCHVLYSCWVQWPSGHVARWRNIQGTWSPKHQLFENTWNLEKQACRLVIFIFIDF